MDKTDRLNHTKWECEADSEFARYGLDSTSEQANLLQAYVEPDLLVLDDLLLARRIADVSAEVLQAIVPPALQAPPLHHRDLKPHRAGMG